MQPLYRFGNLLQEYTRSLVPLMRDHGAYFAIFSVIVLGSILWLYLANAKLPVGILTPSEIMDIYAPGRPETDPYIEVVASCGPYHEGECVNVRSGPGTDYPVVTTLRTGIVLKTKGLIEKDGRKWYKITFDEWLRYPERVSSNWYVAAEYVEAVSGYQPEELRGMPTVSTKRILVDRSDQKLYAYDGETLFAEITISTGLELTPTPRGTFHIYRKTPSRYMQGPIPGISTKMYDLPGVPWNLYFTQEGAVIHGAYWHDHFGTPWSNGCVNLPPENARKLYDWAELGMSVTVRD